MRSQMSTRLILAFGGMLAAVVVACGGAATPASAPTPRLPTPAPAPPAPVVAPTSTPAPVVAPTSQPAQSQPAQTPGSEVSSASFVWTIEDVGGGSKPAIALTDDDSTYVAYMREAMPGFVKVAKRTASGWEPETVAEGYFYGPLDLASGPNGTVHITYHDHQDTTFKPTKGDVVYGVLENGEWSVKNVFNAGHDGWDTRIFVDPSGNAHISAIDPQEFNGDGLEYYGQDDSGEWTVEQVGTGPITYKYATSVAVDPQGNPHITYYDQRGNDLALASRSESGWNIATVDAEGSTGLFSYLVIDADGRFHISYFKEESKSSGTVMYATRGVGDADWEIREVGSLDSLSFGFIGARNITSLALDSEGNPWIAYTDAKVVKLAVWDGSAWQTSTVTESSNNSLGQIVSLKLDSDDAPHLTYVEGASRQSAEGKVKYATAAPG